MEVEQASRINEDICNKFGLDFFVEDPQSLRVLLVSPNDDIIKYASQVMCGTIALKPFRSANTFTAFAVAIYVPAYLQESISAAARVAPRGYESHKLLPTLTLSANVRRLWPP